MGLTQKEGERRGDGGGLVPANIQLVAVYLLELLKLLVAADVLVNVVPVVVLHFHGIKPATCLYQLLISSFSSSSSTSVTWPQSIVVVTWFNTQGGSGGRWVGRWEEFATLPLIQNTRYM